MTLSEWVGSQNFCYTKINIRPWGTYELQVSVDGRVAHLSAPHGRGWPEKDAFEHILTSMMSDTNVHQRLKEWIGEERFNCIVSILQNNNESSAPSTIVAAESLRENLTII